MTPTEKRALRAEHTPGPWRVSVDSYGGFNRIWSPEGFDVATCVGDGCIPLEERPANEQLIASAPELLQQVATLSEALRNCIGSMEVCRNTTFGCLPDARKALQSLEVKP